MGSNNNGVNRKRKQRGHDLQISTGFHIPQNDVDNGDFLALTLAAAAAAAAAANFPPPSPPPARTILPPSETPARTILPPSETPATASHPSRSRRNNSGTPAAGKSATIPPPYPWADSERATVRSLNYLREKGITAIHGDVQCRKCEQKFMMEFDLEQKFLEISTFVAENKALMHQRAPNEWKSPALPRCGFCNQEACVKPVISEKKRTINWLFLLLGQMLGCCTLDQLKYFCKHTKNHRTGAKDRVLFLAYLALCKQLDPNGPFDI